MNSGEIYQKFSPYFTEQVTKVTKKYGVGNFSTDVTSGSYKFWIFSSSELGGSSTRIVEGSQYAWCSDNSITNASGFDVGQPAIANYKNRAGKRLKNLLRDNSGNTQYFWHLRSPVTGIGNNGKFCYSMENGCLGNGNIHVFVGAMGVVMGFAF